MQPATATFLNHPMFASLRRWNKTSLVTEDTLIEEVLAGMDKAGISKGLLTSWHGPEGALIPNDLVARWVKNHPDRFVGIASVPLDKPVKALETLDHCIQNLGFKTLSLRSQL